MGVTHCICHDISLEQVLKISQEQNLETIIELQDLGICSTHCKLCVPFVKKMLDTGVTSFEPRAV